MGLLGKYRLWKAKRQLTAMWGVKNYEKRIAYADAFFKETIREEYQSMFLYEWGCNATFLAWASHKGKELIENGPQIFDTGE